MPRKTRRARRHRRSRSRRGGASVTTTPSVGLSLGEANAKGQYMEVGGYDGGPVDSGSGARQIHGGGEGVHRDDSVIPRVGFVNGGYERKTDGGTLTHTNSMNAGKRRTRSTRRRHHRKQSRRR